MRYSKDYKRLDTLYEDESELIYAAQCVNDNTFVTIKMLKEQYPDKLKIAYLQHEYELTHDNDNHSMLHSESYDQLDKHHALFQEYVNGETTLANYMQTQAINLKTGLTIAIAITQAVEAIHNDNLIHKFINPFNIIITKDHTIKLMNFEQATTLANEYRELSFSNLNYNALPYISPEQTGRINRAIDLRTDLYSLGCVLYQLFTKSLPFSAEDAMGWIHRHIAKVPDLMTERDKEMPAVVATLIDKLLKKSADERYQSAYGLEHDLKRCLTLLDDENHIEEFALATADVSAIFRIPEKVYGRDDELATLYQAFDEVQKEQSQIMLVSGEPGIGKTTLVKELQKHVVENEGYFAAAKYDALKKNIPYSAVSQAFKALIAQLLGEDIGRVKQWKQRLAQAFGNQNTHIIGRD